MKHRLHPAERGRGDGVVVAVIREPGVVSVADVVGTAEQDDISVDSSQDRGTFVGPSVYWADSGTGSPIGARSAQFVEVPLAAVVVADDYQSTVTIDLGLDDFPVTVFVEIDRFRVGIRFGCCPNDLILVSDIKPLVRTSPGTADFDGVVRIPVPAVDDASPSPVLTVRGGCPADVRTYSCRNRLGGCGGVDSDGPYVGWGVTLDPTVPDFAPGVGVMVEFTVGNLVNCAVTEHTVGVVVILAAESRCPCRGRPRCSGSSHQEDGRK